MVKKTNFQKMGVPIGLLPAEKTTTVITVCSQRKDTPRQGGFARSGATPPSPILFTK